jgi:RNA polymerase sigma factor (TIGR02999 family)
LSDTPPLTDLIRDARDGDEAAMRRLFDVTYAELRQLARIRLKRGGRGTMLDTTALVHESYLRFAKLGHLRVEDRHRFFAYAAKVMRSVVVDFVRERMAERRGGGAEHVTLDTAIGGGTDAGAEEVLRVHEALGNLAEFGERLVRVVEMRYFAGMTEAEIAEALEVTERTVRRDWEKARLLLAQTLSPA